MHYTHGNCYTFHCLSNLIGSFKLVLLDSSKAGISFPVCPNFPTWNPSLHFLSEELCKCRGLLGLHLLILKQDGGIYQVPRSGLRNRWPPSQVGWLSQLSSDCLGFCLFFRRWSALALTPPLLAWFLTWLFSSIWHLSI